MSPKDSFEGASDRIGQRLLKWYQKNPARHPWRVQFEPHPDPYVVWVSEIMLQQTVMKAVLKAYPRFLSAFPTVFALAQASPDELQRACAGLGYYRRFALMHRAAQKLVAQKPFRWPSSYDEWILLPGIGPYTGAAIASIAFSEPRAVVDGNVERVICRLLDWRVAPNAPALKKIFLSHAQQLLVEPAGDYNQAIMEFGQNICTPTNPMCHQCPIRGDCLAYERDSQSLAPGPKIKRARMDLALTMRIEQWQGLYHICERDQKSPFLRGIVGFPIERRDAKSPAQKPLGSFKHHITHHNLTVFVYQSKARRKRRSGSYLSKKELTEALTTSLDRKGWKVFQEAMGES